MYFGVGIPVRSCEEGVGDRLERSGSIHVGVGGMVRRSGSMYFGVGIPVRSCEEGVGDMPGSIHVGVGGIVTRSGSMYFGVGMPLLSSAREGVGGMLKR